MDSQNYRSDSCICAYAVLHSSCLWPALLSDFRIEARQPCTFPKSFVVSSHSLTLPIFQACSVVAKIDDILGVLSYFGFACKASSYAQSNSDRLPASPISVFATLRVYGISGNDWRPLLIVIPLALVRPLLTLVSHSPKPDAKCYTQHHPSLRLSDIYL